MIDIRQLRHQPEDYLARLARKGARNTGERLLAVDTAWRAATGRAESLRAQSKLAGKPSPEQLESLRRTKEELLSVEAELTTLESQRKEALDRTPNPPADDVPDGGEDDFEVVREVGTKPSFSFPVRDHLEVAAPRGWIDTERGTKTSALRFVYRMGDLALLELAL